MRKTLLCTALLTLALPLGAQQVRTGLGAGARDSSTARRYGRPGTVEGVVSDTGLRPLAGAEVSILRTTLKLTTQQNGRFRVNGVPAGQYILIVKRIGYRPASAVIDVPAEDTVRLAYTLEKTDYSTMDTVRVITQSVSARMAEFEQRRRFGIGEFMGPEEIDRRAAVFATELMRKFTTVNVQAVQSSRGIYQVYYPVSRRATGSVTPQQSAPGEEPIPANVCVLTVFVDNVMMPTPFNLDLLPTPKDLQGIEVYAGAATVPAQFAGLNRGCGVMLVWTKDR